MRRRGWQRYTANPNRELRTNRRGGWSRTEAATALATFRRLGLLDTVGAAQTASSPARSPHVSPTPTTDDHTPTSPQQSTTAEPRRPRARNGRDRAERPSVSPRVPTPPWNPHTTHTPDGDSVRSSVHRKRKSGLRFSPTIELYIGPPQRELQFTSAGSALAPAAAPAPSVDAAATPRAASSPAAAQLRCRSTSPTTSPAAAASPSAPTPSSQRLCTRGELQHAIHKMMMQRMEEIEQVEPSLSLLVHYPWTHGIGLWAAQMYPSQRKIFGIS